MEFKQEHLLFFAFAVLAIILLWDIRHKPNAPASTVTPPADGDPEATVEPPVSSYDDSGSVITAPFDNADGPTYLTYNQPYGMAPPVVNTLPETTSGQIGQTLNINVG